MKKAIEITREDAVALYNLIFTETHSDGFKEGEIKMMLRDHEYRFMDAPIQGWKNVKAFIIKWFEENGYEVPENFLSTYPH